MKLNLSPGLLCILLGLMLPGVPLAADLLSRATTKHSVPHSYEDRLVVALDLIKNGQMDEALEELQRLTKSKPDFKLAQLIYGDLLLAKSQTITDFGNYSTGSYEHISALRNEARVRWQHHVSPPPLDRIPNSLIQLSDQQKYAIVVDLKASRLFLFQNRDGVPHLYKDFYVTIGKNGIGKIIEGDQKTPTGVYFVTGQIDSEKLPDLYGDGAFPINYPNAWDVRHKRTGYGIWLHGTPSNTYTRPPRDSNGCVIVSNEDFRTISQYIEVDETPVVLADHIEWIEKKQWLSQRQNYQDFIEQWRVDWESRDADRYLSHYSKQYAGLGNDYQSWVDYKRRVNPSKRYIKVKLSKTSIFLYPGKEDLMVVTFEQDYSSDDFRRRFIKRQYWKMETDGKWRIIYEGSVS